MTILKKCTRTFGILLAVGLMSVMTVQAAGQAGGVLTPGSGPAGNDAGTGASNVPRAAPQPRLNKKYPVWVGYLVIFLMIVGIMGVSLMPSKRSHQD